MLYLNSLFQVIVLQVFLVIIVAVKAPEGRRPICSPITQFTVVDPNKPHGQETCRECPKCPPGQGLPIQCGSIVANGIDTDCKPCEANKTYSIRYDSSTCKPCNLCGLKNVLQHCTPQQNRKCGISCPPEHFLDEHDDCTKCYFCCANVPEHYRLKKCKDLGMPQNLQCQRTHENEMCRALFDQTTTTLPVTTTTTTTLNTKMVENETSPHSSNWSHPLTTGVSESLTNSDPTTSLQMEKGIKPSPSEEKTDNAGLIVVFSILAIIIIVLIIVVVISRQKATRSPGFTEVTTDDTDIALIPEGV